MAGERLRQDGSAGEKLRWLVVAGALCLAAGAMLNQTLCPSVKRIWTPSWALFSSGWTFWMLAGFYAAIDITGWKRWALPLVVVGMNSIAMYSMAQLLKPWVTKTYNIHLGYLLSEPESVNDQGIATYDLFAGTYGPLWQSLVVLFTLWAVCGWMYRRKIFLKI